VVAEHAAQKRFRYRANPVVGDDDEQVVEIRLPHLAERAVHAPCLQEFEQERVDALRSLIQLVDEAHDGLGKAPVHGAEQNPRAVGVFHLDARDAARKRGDPRGVDANKEVFVARPVVAEIVFHPATELVGEVSPKRGLTHAGRARNQSRAYPAAVAGGQDAQEQFESDLRKW
jgi:hypothetical protein